MKICIYWIMLSADENQKTLYCANCGLKNHVYKKCKEPITSYGIICFRANLTFQRDINLDVDSTLNVDFLKCAIFGFSHS